MIKTAQCVKELAAIGVHTPPHPQPPFEAVPDSPTAEDRFRDEEYQAACEAWIWAVAQIYGEHFPNAKAGSR